MSARMTPNLAMHRSDNSRLRRLLPPGDCSRWAASERVSYGHVAVGEQ